MLETVIVLVWLQCRSSLWLVVLCSVIGWCQIWRNVSASIFRDKKRLVICLVLWFGTSTSESHTASNFRDKKRLVICLVLWFGTSTSESHTASNFRGSVIMFFVVYIVILSCRRLLTFRGRIVRLSSRKKPFYGAILAVFSVRPSVEIFQF